MAKVLVQSGQFRGLSKQSLRNVLMHSPTVIWVQNGMKQLWWRERALKYTSAEWLMIPACQYLTFVNVPEQAAFHSKTLTFFEAPPQEWVRESMAGAASQAQEPRATVTEQLAYCFDILFAMQEKHFSLETQRQFLYAFYAELRHAGILHLLFPGEPQTLWERVSRYLSANPGDEHKVELVAEHLSMSRATLIRKLSAEGTSFRKVLAEVRMGYALTLLQQSPNQLDVAMACGYQSEARFSARFKQQFGLTPTQYRKTL